MEQTMPIVNCLASAAIIREVVSEAEQWAFLEMPAGIYDNDPNYIRPLDRDISGVFDPDVNVLLNKGDSKRWLLWSGNGVCIGRIAAFFKVKMDENGEKRVGGVGFFECINDHTLKIR